MAGNKFNQIEFCKGDFDDEDYFWKTISEQLRILSDNGYEVEFYYEDCGIYIIRFNYNHHQDRYADFGTPHIEWVDEEWFQVTEGE